MALQTESAHFQCSVKMQPIPARPSFLLGASALLACLALVGPAALVLGAGLKSRFDGFGVYLELNSETSATLHPMSGSWLQSCSCLATTKTPVFINTRARVAQEWRKLGEVGFIIKYMNESRQASGDFGKRIN